MTTRIRETKKKKTRQAIIQAAGNLFREKGFEKTSVEELARASGIGKGTIYSYFRKKSDILKALWQEELECLHDDLTTHTDKDTPILQQMLRFYIYQFKQMTQGSEFARLYLQQALFPWDFYREQQTSIEDSHSRLVLSLLQDAQERGELRKDINPLYLTGHFYGLYLLLIFAWFNGRVRTDEAEIVLETLYRQAMEGIQPQICQADLE